MTPAEAADLLETSGQALVNILRSMPPELGRWRPAPDEWCANECVGHLIDAERRAFAGRIRTIVGADNPRFEPWDAAVVERGRNDCKRSPQELIEEFEPLRRESLAMLRSVHDDQLQRFGSHPVVGSLTVSDLIHEWVHHDDNHLRQMLANIQAYVWPHMGNAQRFSSA